jgi:imidazole glycerol-phosphate synthase subunit HisF
MGGFDLPLVAKVTDRVSVPVICAGGCGHYEHLRDVFHGTRVRAAACGSLFNFTDSNPIRAKAFLSNHGLPFRKV